jgi:hypothetical protein
MVVMAVLWNIVGRSFVVSHPRARNKARGWGTGILFAIKQTRVALVAVALTPVVSAVAADKPAGIDALRAYEGSWKTSLQFFDTAHSKASTDKSALRNDCWKSGEYFACNQFVNGESKVLLVFTYDAAKNEYSSYQIPQGGGSASSGRLVIEGNRWTFPWQTGEGANTTWFRVLNTWDGPDKIEFRQEFSTDQVHWTLMGQGETRRSGK